MGGATATKPTGSTQNLAFNPATLTYATKTNLPDARAFHTAAVSLSGQIYIAGDLLGSDLTFPLYDPPSDKFVQFPPIPRGRSGPGSGVLSDGRLILFGGVFGDIVDVFHPDKVLYQFQPN